MQKTDGLAKTAQRRTQNSTTLNRRYVKRPVRRTATTMSVERSSKIQHFRVENQGEAIAVRTTSPRLATEEKQVTEVVQKHPLQSSAINRMNMMRSQQITNTRQGENKMTAKEIKDQAIQKALMSAATSEQTASTKKTKKLGKMHFGFGRVVLALSCAAAVAMAIVYFVNLNMPDISLRVAAMQTGINASYPGYVPRDYAVSSITSEDKRIVLDFKNSSEGNAFTLVEETSSWDSNALLNNYVKPEYGDNYKIIKEQGLTIYINGSNAAWVNGGVIYKITADNGVLTNKQICSIATSL